MTNNLASIIIDDSLLSHSLIIRSKKYKTIDEQSKTIELQKKLITKMYKEKVELEKRVQQTIN